MKFNYRNVVTWILSFIILVYPYNYTLKARFFSNNSLMFVIIFIAFLGLIILGKVKKMTLLQFKTLAILFIIFLMQIINNYYFKEKSEGKVFLFSIYLLLPFIVLSNEKAKDCMIKLIGFFSIEHIAGTFFVQIFRSFYLNNILPWLSAGAENVASRNLMKGLNPGLTMHYSTNGIYLSIAVIYFFSNYIADRRKKNLILACLAIVALLLTGKRAHTLFAIIACIVIYVFHCRDRISKKIIVFFSAAIIAIVSIFILSMFMPQVLNVINRFEESSQNGELLSGRESFYELAINMWKKHKIVGNGWGAFSYNFQYKIFSKEEFLYGYLDAHNVYLQLLCECGIIGLTFFVCLAIGNLKKSWESIKRVTDRVDYSNMLFSFGFQIFFLMYCFSGNPLYDIQCYSVYFIAIGVMLNELGILKNKVGGKIVEKG